MNLKPFGQALKELRVGARKTQTQAARACGVTRDMFGDYEEGYRRPRKCVLRAFLNWVSQSPAEHARVIQLADYPHKHRYTPGGFFGTWLAVRLHSLGLNPHRVARALQIGQNTPYEWVTGRAHPLPEIRQRLASLLGVPKTTLHSLIAQSMHEKTMPATEERKQTTLL